jgi:hypothetical protein
MGFYEEVKAVLFPEYKVFYVGCDLMPSGFAGSLLEITAISMFREDLRGIQGNPGETHYKHPFGRSSAMLRNALES